MHKIKVYLRVGNCKSVYLGTFLNYKNSIVYYVAAGDGYYSKGSIGNQNEKNVMLVEPREVFKHKSYIRIKK